MMAWQCTPITGIRMVGSFDRAVGQFVVERTREDARGGRLADAAHAGEDPGLRDAAGLERVRDRAHHGILADEVLEASRAGICARARGRPATRAGTEPEAADFPGSLIVPSASLRATNAD